MPTRIYPQSQCRDCGGDFPNAEMVRELMAGAPEPEGTFFHGPPPETCPVCGAVPSSRRTRDQI